MLSLHSHVKHFCCPVLLQAVVEVSRLPQGSPYWHSLLLHLIFFLIPQLCYFFFFFFFQCYKETSGAASEWNHWNHNFNLLIPTRFPNHCCTIFCTPPLKSTALPFLQFFMPAKTRTTVFWHSQCMSVFAFNWMALARWIINQTAHEDGSMLYTSLGSLEGLTSL